MSRAIDADEGNVQVKHTLETTLVLNNLGLNVPSPVEYQYNWPGKYTPFDHQRPMTDFHVRNPKGLNLSEMGCVDGATEYLSPTGWRRIDSYVEGKVAQYIPETRTIEWVDGQYVKLPCKRMIRFKTTRGIDQLLSPEHRVLLANGSVVTAEEIAARYGSQDMFNRNLSFRTTFQVVGSPGFGLSDVELRVQVAANADGHFKNNKVFMRLKRPRKIKRMQELLVAAKIEFDMRPCKPEGFMLFRFKPLRPKGFTLDWYACTQHQLSIVADEVVYWDGSPGIGRRGPCFTGTYQDCTFVQYAWAANNLRATMRQDMRSPDVWDLRSSYSTEPGLVSRNTARMSNVRYTLSPDGFKYCFMVPSTFLLLRRNGCIFATGNTGKSFSALWGADYLMTLGEVHKCLILAPLSILETIWQQDIFDILMHRSSVITHGDREYRTNAFTIDVDFYIANHDMIRHPEIAKLVRKRKDIDLVILDEASFFRNSRNLSYKYFAWATEHKKRIWLLTGTPCPNAPTDAWALARLVCPQRVPKFFGTFQRMTMKQVDEFKWRPVNGHEQIVFDALQPAWRIRKKDCMTLPPLTVTNRLTRLTQAQEHAYGLMREYMILQAKTTKITAVNAADALLKLRQICTGSVKNPTDDTYETIDHSHRLKELIDVVNQASAKVLVIVPFKGIIRVLETELAKHFSLAVLNGDVSIKERNRIITAFKSGPDPRVLLCHPKVMAHGLNLTEADTTIFYAPIYSHDEYSQVIERFNRAGQTRKMTVVRISACRLEQEIYALLDNRSLNQDNILKLYERVIAT